MCMALGLKAQSRMPDFVVDPALMVLDRDGMTRSIPDFPWVWSRVARFPHMGNPRVPVILIEYADYPLTYRQTSDWNLWLNSTETQHDNMQKSYSSVAEYFDYCSFGQFRPVFDVYGPYNLKDYFGKDISGNDSIAAFRTQYGYNKESKLVEVALKVADKDIDFKKYCTVASERCDLVFVIAAGEGHNYTNSNKDIHPKSGVNNFSGLYDCVQIRNWGISNELVIKDGQKLQAGIGVFCHEMSHGMGLPDLYPNVNKSDYNNDEPEEWDIMDDGENCLIGFWPHPYNAWERDVMGWIDPDTLRESRSITLYPLADARGTACKFVNPHNANEWWMIENIPAGVTIDETGQTVREYWYNWAMNKCDGRNGLLIMHMDNNDSGNGYGYLTLNAKGAPNDPSSAKGGHPHCTVLPADSLLVSTFNFGLKTTMPDGTKVDTTWDLYDSSVKGDLYPGASNVTSLWKFRNYYGNKDADSKVVDLTDEGYAIRNITLNEDGSVTFDFYYGDAPTALQEVTTVDRNNVVSSADVYHVTPNLIIVKGQLRWLR